MPHHSAPLAALPTDVEPARPGERLSPVQAAHRSYHGGLIPGRCPDRWPPLVHVREDELLRLALHLAEVRPNHATHEARRPRVLWGTTARGRPLIFVLQLAT